MRISPVVVGVVVIGLGTSAPEFLVSGVAAARGDASIALGNLTGSNIINLLPDVLRSGIRRAGFGAVGKRWPGTDDGFTALNRLAGPESLSVRHRSGWSGIASACAL
jgi:hypothetical protein